MLLRATSSRSTNAALGRPAPRRQAGLVLQLGSGLLPADQPFPAPVAEQITEQMFGVHVRELFAAMRQVTRRGSAIFRRGRAATVRTGRTARRRSARTGGPRSRGTHHRRRGRGVRRTRALTSDPPRGQSGQTAAHPRAASQVVVEYLTRWPAAGGEARLGAMQQGHRHRVDLPAVEQSAREIGQRSKLRNRKDLQRRPSHPRIGDGGAPGRGHRDHPSGHRQRGGKDPEGLRRQRRRGGVARGPQTTPGVDASHPRR